MYYGTKVLHVCTHAYMYKYLYTYNTYIYLILLGLVENWQCRRKQDYPEGGKSDCQSNAIPVHPMYKSDCHYNAIPVHFRFRELRQQFYNSVI